MQIFTKPQVAKVKDGLVDFDDVDGVAGLRVEVPGRKTVTYEDVAHIRERIEELMALPTRSIKDVAEQRILTGVLEKAREYLPAKQASELPAQVTALRAVFEAQIKKHGGDVVAALGDYKTHKTMSRILELADETGVRSAFADGARRFTSRMNNGKAPAIAKHFNPNMNAAEAERARKFVQGFRALSDEMARKARVAARAGNP